MRRLTPITASCSSNLKLTILELSACAGLLSFIFDPRLCCERLFVLPYQQAGSDKKLTNGESKGQEAGGNDIILKPYDLHLYLLTSAILTGPLTAKSGH